MILALPLTKSKPVSDNALRTEDIISSEIVLLILLQTNKGKKNKGNENRFQHFRFVSCQA